MQVCTATSERIVNATLVSVPSAGSKARNVPLPGASRGTLSVTLSSSVAADALPEGDAATRNPAMTNPATPTNRHVRTALTDRSCTAH